MIYNIISIVTLGISCLLGIVAFLIKRAVFHEIDLIRKDMDTLRISKVDIPMCIQAHLGIKEDLVEIKSIGRDNAVILQQIVVDVAVLKASKGS